MLQEIVDGVLDGMVEDCVLFFELVVGREGLHFFTHARGFGVCLGRADYLSQRVSGLWGGGDVAEFDVQCTMTEAGEEGIRGAPEVGDVGEGGWRGGCAL